MRQQQVASGFAASGANPCFVLAHSGRPATTDARWTVCEGKRECSRAVLHCDLSGFGFHRASSASSSNERHCDGLQ